MDNRDAAQRLLAWLSAEDDQRGDATWRQFLTGAVDACDDDHVAVCALLERLENASASSNRKKWPQLVADLEWMEEHGDIVQHQSIRTQIIRMKLRFPAHDSVVVLSLEGENVKRLSAPALRTANSLEERRPSLWKTSSRHLRRAVTTADEADRRFPLLEPTSLTLSQRSGMVAASLTRSFRQRVSSVLQGGFEETFYCFICFENVPLSHAFTLTACGHQYCHDCLTMYFEVKIRDGEVYPVCFHAIESVSGQRVACATPIVPTDIESLVSPDVWAKYQRFKFNKEYEHGRQCPYCSYSQSCKGPEQPECVCQKCKRVFCFTHSNAHEGGTCADFERKNLETEKLNRTAIASIAKPCPGCSSNVEKNGGCNHMTCIACQTSFCWICGQIVDSVAAPDHFAVGQQLVDMDNQTRVERIGWRLFRVLFLTICIPIGVVVTLVLTIMSGCCIPCIFWIHEDPKQTFLGTVNTIALYVQLMLALVIVGPISLLAITLRCVRSCFCTCCFWGSQRARPSERDASVFVLENDHEINV